MRPAAPEATKIARIGGRRPPPADGVSDRAGAVPTATATPRGGEDGQARRLPDHAPPGNLTEVRCARWYARPAANGPGAPPRMRRSHGPQAAPRGCSSMVELEPSKLVTRVRFPSPALTPGAGHALTLSLLRVRSPSTCPEPHDLGLSGVRFSRSCR